MVVDYMACFDRRPDLCGGELVVKGTRVPVRTILASLAEGANTAEILADFPTLTEAKVRTVLAVFETEAVESWRECFVVITERKIRVHRAT